jgi:cation transport ATPase
MKEQTRQRVGKIGDSIFLSPTFQALTIGVPFCVFKLIFGLLALRLSMSSVSFRVLAWLVIAWALTDLIMNLARVYFHFSGREAPIEYCTIAQAGRLLKRPGLFLAIDTLLSFSIICFVLWSGWITLLGRQETYFWYAATTLNLISVSVVNIWIELRREPS